jgi:acyl carrier protein
MQRESFITITSLLTDKFNTPVDTITEQTELLELGLDSLTLMEFVFAVEDKFNIRIPEEKLDPRNAGVNLAQVCDVIDELKAKAQTK